MNALEACLFSDRNRSIIGSIMVFGDGMKQLKTTDGIVPLGEFKAKAATLLRKLKDTGEPIVVTQNGRPAAVVLSPDAYEEMRERQAFLEAVASGIADAEADRLVDGRRVKAWMKSWGTAKEQPIPR